MKNFLRLAVLIGFISLFSCKKAIENKQRHVLIDAITNGEWQVHQFVEESCGYYDQFYGYTFKFEERALYMPSMWDLCLRMVPGSGDVNNYTITSHVPNSFRPVEKIKWRLETN